MGIILLVSLLFSTLFYGQDRWVECEYKSKSEIDTYIHSKIVISKKASGSFQAFIKYETIPQTEMSLYKFSDEYEFSFCQKSRSGFFCFEKGERNGVRLFVENEKMTILSGVNSVKDLGRVDGLKNYKILSEGLAVLVNKPTGVCR